MRRSTVVRTAAGMAEETKSVQKTAGSGCETGLIHLGLGFRRRLPSSESDPSRPGVAGAKRENRAHAQKRENERERDEGEMVGFFFFGSIVI